MTKKMWKNQIDYVIDIVERFFNYEVIIDTDEEDRVDFCEKKIYINSRSHPETRFYTLLHEYGHVEIHEAEWASLAEGIPAYRKFRNTRSGRSHSGKISTIAEEIESWKRGRLLALHECLYVNDKKYEKHMNEALMSYIRWAAE
tara:strand:+ start:1791 stop:2222 length:432 start_codon:yes stop_codon:yes gene_type:complete